MNKFIFDLQRFADYELEAGGSSVTIDGNNRAKSIAVTTDGTTKNYSLNVNTNSRAIVSADADGTVKVQVVYGDAKDFLDTSTGEGTSFVLTGGTFKNERSPRPIILGENGPLLSDVWAGNSSIPVYITLTPYTDYNSVTLTCTGATIIGFSIAGLGYGPVLNSSTNTSTMTLRIQDGKTYIDVDENNTDTITYDDETERRTYTQVNGTVILAAENDGSEAYITGLEKGDVFTLDDIKYKMGKTRLMATDGTTWKFFYRNVGETTDFVPFSQLDFDSGYFPSEASLIDGVDFYSVLNPGLAPLLTDGTGATQYTGTTYSTTGVAFGVGNTQVTMDVPEKLSPSDITRILFDIAPPSAASQSLNVYMPYNATSFYFNVAITNDGTLTVNAYNNGSQVDTTSAINLVNYGVGITKPIRLMLQANFADGSGDATFVSTAVGSYVRNQQLASNVIFDGTNRTFKFASASGDEFKISNIIVRDEAVGKITETIVRLPVSATDTDMDESNGTYIARAVDKTILQTPDVAALIEEFGGASSVTGILLVGNPAYKTGDGLTTLTGIDKAGGTVTEHNTITLGDGATDAISNNWAPTNMTLNDLANHQFGWKAGAPS